MLRSDGVERGGKLEAPISGSENGGPSDTPSEMSGSRARSADTIDVDLTQSIRLLHRQPLLGTRTALWTSIHTPAGHEDCHQTQNAAGCRLRTNDRIGSSPVHRYTPQARSAVCPCGLLAKQLWRPWFQPWVLCS